MSTKKRPKIPKNTRQLPVYQPLKKNNKNLTRKGSSRNNLPQKYYTIDEIQNILQTGTDDALYQITDHSNKIFNPQV